MRRISAVWRQLLWPAALGLFLSIPADAGEGSDGPAPLLAPGVRNNWPALEPAKRLETPGRPAVSPRGILQTPGNIVEPRWVADWGLTLGEARRIALANNKDIASVSFVPLETEATVMAEESVFDPVLAYGGAWDKVDRQSATEVESLGAVTDATINDGFGPGSAGDTVALSKRLRTGGVFRTSYGAFYDKISPEGSFVLVNPYWFSTLNFTLEHSLLRGRGIDVNTAGTWIARAGYQQSLYAVRTVVHEQLREVEFAYWEIYYAYKDLASRREAVSFAHKVWEKEKEKFELGDSSIPEVAQAHEQYAQYRIELAAARNQVFQAENRLRRQMGIPGWDGRRILLIDPPTRVELRVDWQAAVRETLRRRPELLAQQQAIRAARLQLYRAQNGLLPDVNFVANYGITGLENRWDQSITTLVDNRYTDWTLGFTYEQAIGRRPARAELRRARAVLCREQAVLRKKEHEIRHGLQAAYQELVAAQCKLSLYQDRVTAAAAQLHARQEFYALGDMSVDLLLRAQVAYVDSQREQALGIMRYNQAIVQWEFSRGTLLDRSNVVLAGESPEAETESPPEVIPAPEANDPKQTGQPPPTVQRLPPVKT